MYFIEDKKGAIREVQTYLLELAYIDYLTKKVSVDGVYGSDTTEAVSEYQAKSGLAVSGVVDLLTFDRLYRDYIKARDQRLAPDFLASQRPFYFRIGDDGADVLAIHALLGALALYERDLPRVPSGSFYSPMTAEAVRFMQRIFGLAESGEVDYALYRRIEEELRARQEEAKVTALHTAD